MNSCVNKLSTIYFVGGTEKTLGFRIFSRGGSPIDVQNCTARFAVIDSVNRYGKPLIAKDMVPYSDNILSVDFSFDDTVDLFGKYIYQISIVDSEGTVEEPQQGDLYIQNNIDKAYLK